MKNDFGERFNLALGERTMGWLSKATGIAPSTLTGYRKGSIPSADAGFRLADAMGVSARWLVTGEGKMLRDEPVADGGAQTAGKIVRRLDAIEDELNRLKVPIAVEQLGEASPLKDMYRQLVDIAANPVIADALRARADMLLDLGFASIEAAERREGRQRQGTEEFQRNLRSVTDIYTGILRELDWQPPALTGMAVRDAMIVDGLSEKMASFILGALKQDLSEADKLGRK